jgi:UDP-N-acetylmuramoyl-L-alanyl-D-glutamate--2,6-diaminopimelate ligase
MRLRDILPADAEIAAGSADIDVGGITSDSRTVRAGDVFVAIAGGKADGLRFVASALAAGAAAVVANRPPQVPLPAGVAFVQVGNIRRTLALAAAKFYPRQPAAIAAVTGTSGKTSVAAFTRQIWTALGHQAASIGTVGVVSPRGEIYGSLTTPDPVALHRSLDQLAGDGVTHLAIEASSHGLDQHRLDGLRIAAAGFTNITRDHLDYHPSFQDYLNAKLRLFQNLLEPTGTVVIQVDHDHADAVVAAATARGATVMTVGRAGTGIRLVEAAIDGFAQRFTVEHDGRRFQVRLPLVGEFQIENALVAAGLAIATGSDAAAVFATLGALRGAKGRLELVGEKRGAPIFVDYAHKPDALAKAIAALRPYVTGKLVVVFGAGGDRDRGKRPLMGAVAAEKADTVIVTDDNPRSENPAAIRAAILAGSPGATEIGDRREAIRAAIAGLSRGDILLVAGKGHETGQIIGDRTIEFSDHEAVASALGELAA